MMVVKVPKIIQSFSPSLVWKKENSEKEIYLTFDDSPTPKFTLWILNLLSSLSIKATFFCIGEFAEKHPKIIDEILNKGHQIGNHTYSHKNGILSSTRTYLQEIEKCKNVLPKTNLFRPPFGKIYPWQISKIRKEYKIIMWDVLSYDFTKNISSNKLKKNILKNTESGSIIVFHDNKKSERILKGNLEEILKTLLRRGFKFGII
ncbi:MAG TPA: polysaccharide deacetylase family protein [Flavobacteriales bacterium]|nr:polysaccharide deacetylase family protein [Flavobacteriales bacterium]